LYLLTDFHLHRRNYGPLNLNMNCLMRRKSGRRKNFANLNCLAKN
jgi:hypothetical protein